MHKSFSCQVWFYDLCFFFSRLCVHNVTGLSSGKEYQFRILAENFYGRSDPCEPTAPIKTEEAPEGKLRKEGNWLIVTVSVYLEETNKLFLI